LGEAQAEQLAALGHHWEQGQFAEARPLYEQALSIQRELGDRRSEGSALGNLAGLHHEQGRPEEALELYEEALDLHRQVGDRNQEAVALYSQAALERRAFGQLDKARQMALQADCVLRQTGRKLYLASCLCEQGHLALAEGWSGQSLLEEAEQLANSLAVLPRSELGRALSRLRRAQHAFEEGKPDRLFRGELAEDLPESLRCWIEQSEE